MELLKQIGCCLRGTSKGVFGMGLLPGLELFLSFLRLQLVEKMKARVEFWNMQAPSCDLPAGRCPGSTFRVPRRRRSRQK